MGFGRFHFESQARELIRDALLHQRNQLHWRRFFYFSEFEASYHFAKTQLLVRMLGSGRKIVLQKILVDVRDTAVETLQPRGALFGCGRIRKLHLRRANRDRKV